jgi:hypothetical protein
MSHQRRLVETKKIQGQAVIEYLLIAIVMVSALWMPFPGDEKKRSVVTILSDAIKQEYRAYKYAHSIGNLPLS